MLLSKSALLPSTRLTNITLAVSRNPIMHDTGVTSTIHVQHQQTVCLFTTPLPEIAANIHRVVTGYSCTSSTR